MKLDAEVLEVHRTERGACVLAAPRFEVGAAAGPSDVHDVVDGAEPLVIVGVSVEVQDVLRIAVTERVEDRRKRFLAGVVPR